MKGKLKSGRSLKPYTILIFLLALTILCAWPVAADTNASDPILENPGEGNDSEGAVAEEEEKLTLEPTGQIQISTVPNGSEIYIEGAYRGKTPALITGIPVGDYEVVLKGNGYDDAYEKVFVRPGETEVIFRNLGVKKGVLSISSDPSGASIYLDGKYRGVTPNVFDAEIGAHTLELKKNWYGTVSQEVVVSYEDPLVLEAKLHINLLFSAAGVLFILFFVLFAKKHPEVLRVKVPTGSGGLKKYGKNTGRKDKIKKKFRPGSGPESGLESGSESKYLVDLDKLPEPEFKYSREIREK